jgi:hypothetical protein
MKAPVGQFSMSAIVIASTIAFALKPDRLLEWFGRMFQDP